MSKGPFFRTAVAVVLAVILLVTGVPQAQSGPLPQVPLPYHKYLPFIQRDVPVTLEGTVTNNGAAAANEPIRLFLSRNGGTYEQLSETTTDANGFYRFNLMIEDPANERFFVAWFNPETQQNTSNKMWDFFCHQLTYSDPASERTCNFDISDIALVAPDGGESINFPYTFRWNARTYPNASALDDYMIAVYDESDLIALSEPLGYVSQARMGIAPPDTTTGTPYYWAVVVVTPSGEGISYWSNEVYFNDLNSPAINAQGGPEWRPAEGRDLR